MSQFFSAQHLRDEALGNAGDDDEKQAFAATVVHVGLQGGRPFRLLPVLGDDRDRPGSWLLQSNRRPCSPADQMCSSCLTHP